MRYLRRSAIVGTLIALTTVMVGAGPAEAGIDSGNWGYYTTNGVDYKCLSVIYTSSPSTSPWAFAETDAVPTNTAVGANWMAGSARLFTSSGTLLYESAYEYNNVTIPKNGVWDVFGPYHNGAGTYYSRGTTKAWNGATYNAYFAPISRSLATGT